MVKHKSLKIENIYELDGITPKKEYAYYLGKIGFLNEEPHINNPLIFIYEDRYGLLCTSLIKNVTKNDLSYTIKTKNTILILKYI